MWGILLSALPWTGLVTLVVALLQASYIGHLKDLLAQEEDRKKLVQLRLSEATVKLNAAMLQLSEARSESVELRNRLTVAEMSGNLIMDAAAVQAADILSGRA